MWPPSSVKRGNTPTIRRWSADLKQEPQMYKQLLVERNRNWLPKLEALLPAGPDAHSSSSAPRTSPDELMAFSRRKATRWSNCDHRRPRRR